MKVDKKTLTNEAVPYDICILVAGLRVQDSDVQS